MVIDHILASFIGEASSGIGIAWFYCDYTNEDSMKTVEHTVSCLLRQLLESLDTLPASITTLYKAHKESQFRMPRPSVAELTGLLDSVLASFSRVFVIIDALDEYPSHTRNNFLQVLRRLDPSHLLITSREHIRLDEVIPEYLRIDVHADEQDLKVYARSRLDKLHLARQVRAKPELQDAIINQVISSASDL
jgi:hypothetical protein